MERERVLLSLFGKKLVAYKKLENGEIKSSGVLNPIFNRFKFFAMMAVQSNFYKHYDIGTWKGPDGTEYKVANTYAPPVKSGAMWRALKQALKGRVFFRPYPIAMTFAVTYKCQCNCVHCSAGNHMKPDQEELSTEEAMKLIDDSQDLGISILAFTGGEPLLREDLFDLIAHVDKKKTVPIMFTNGQFLTEENADRLAEAGLYSIFVSIDTPIAEEHDKLRGMPGIFNQALEGLERMKERDVFVGLSSYATRSSTTLGMYKQIHELGVKLGVQNIMLFDGVPTGKMLKDTSEVLTPDQREEIREFSSNLFENKVVPMMSSQSWQNSIEAYLGGIGCLAGHIQYYASAYGDIAPCDFTPLSFGNIREEPLKVIWRKMTKHPIYKKKSTCCRMQNDKFRHCYIDPIPDDAILPYDINKLPAVNYRKAEIPQNNL